MMEIITAIIVGMLVIAALAFYMMYREAMAQSKQRDTDLAVKESKLTRFYQQDQEDDDLDEPTFMRQSRQDGVTSDNIADLPEKPKRTGRPKGSKNKTKTV